jgi:hypothetical protein
MDVAERIMRRRRQNGAAEQPPVRVIVMLFRPRILLIPQDLSIGDFLLLDGF